MAIVSRQDRAPEPAPSGKGSDFPLRRLKFRAMATQCEIQYTAPAGDAQAAKFAAAAEGWVHAFEAKYSRFQPTSLVSRINDAAGREWVAIDPETEGLLKMCDTLVFMTRGILDPTALPLIRIWNWKAVPPVIPSAAEIAAALKLGGFGKEYAVDIVSLIAKDHGIMDSLVDFGHDLRAVGAPPGRPAWHIGLEDPKAPGTIWASIGLSGKSIASSGDYIRSFTIG